MLCFKFQQNRTINEQFDFLEEGGFEEKGASFINFSLNYYWHSYKNVLFKFQQNRNVNE